MRRFNFVHRKEELLVLEGALQESAEFEIFVRKSCSHIGQKYDNVSVPDGHQRLFEHGFADDVAISIVAAGIHKEKLFALPFALGYMTVSGNSGGWVDYSASLAQNSVEKSRFADVWATYQSN